MNTPIDGSAAAGSLLADSRPNPELIGDNFPQPVASDGESEGHWLHDNETREVAAEGESHGDEDTVAPELAARDDAGEADDVALEPAPAVADSAVSTFGEHVATAGPEQAVPQLSNQALGSLLDELTAELVTPEAFDGKVDDRAREKEWLGKHTPLSLSLYRAKLDRTGKCTFKVDENGVLLDDPVMFRLAREAGAQITLRVHRGLSEAKKSNFILLSQGRDRERTEAENRELKRRIILAGLLQGLTYEATAELAGVHPNTVRNVETRAAADPNSKLGIRPDGRLNPETREMISQAAVLRKEGKSNAIIAEIFGTDVETVGKWLKDPPARDKAKGSKGKKKTAARRKAPIEDLAANDGPPELHRRALEHLNQDAQYYAELHELAQGDVQEEVKKMSGSVEDLLYYAIYGSQLAAAADARLEQLLPAGDEEDVVEEAPPGDSSPDEAGYETSEILSGNVPEIDPDLAPVSLPTGDRGVIAEGDTGVARQAVAEDGDEARVRVNGFDPEPGHPDRESMAQDDRTRAVEPNLDDRSSPYDRFFGRKGEPKK